MPSSHGKTAGDGFTVMEARKHIFLIGFPGSGKTTIGQALARILNVPFYDTDLLIEQRQGKTIPDIFRQEGEAAFRQYEHDVIAALPFSGVPKMVVAVGGGAYMQPSVRKILHSHGVVVYLSCSQKELYRRLKDNAERPLLQNVSASHTNRQLKETIKTLLDRRAATYRLADIRISTTARGIEEIAHRILTKVEQVNGYC